MNADKNKNYANLKNVSLIKNDYPDFINKIRDNAFEQFKKLGIPMLIIDDWAEFKNLELNKELYNEVWGDFNPSSLNFSLFAENG